MAFIIFLGLFSFTSFAGEVKRDVLALWDSHQGKIPDYSTTDLHRKLEFVFNHYGLKLTYHDVSKGLPSAASMDRFAGIVTWFSDDRIIDTRAYGSFLKAQLKNQKKLLVLGELGFGKDIQSVNAVMNPIGIEVAERFFDNPLLFSIGSSRGEQFVEFERSLVGEIFSFRQVKNVDPKNQTWLNLKVRGEKFGSDVVIVGPQLAYVQAGFATFNHPQDDRSYWRVNPFTLVHDLFARDLRPIPDTTTMNGQRLFFSHIDGDGFMNRSEVDRSKYCSEIILERILKKYPLPVTASVITLEMDPSKTIVTDPKAQETAKQIFTLDHIEPASHTYSHPLSWELNPSQTERISYLGPKAKGSGPILSYKLPGLGLSYEAETSGSIDFINKNLASSKRKAHLLLWSGSCRPPAQALAPLEKEKYLNMNGGDSRLDNSYNSHSHLSSLYRQVGPYLQVYSGNANENVYTNLWSPPFSGFKDVIQTFERTESPRRLKPVNAYYHYYSGEHQASLNSLLDIYNWAMKHELHPIRASLYPAIVHGFVDAQIEEKAPHRFVIKNHKSLKTFRFETTSLAPDYSRSVNVIGHRFYQNELYVFTGEASDSTIELTSSPSKAPHLVTSNARILETKREGNGIIYRLEGFLPVKAQFMEHGKLRTFSSAEKTLEVRLKL